MKKLVTVRLLVDTGRNKAGDVRKLNAERAEAWIQAGWAEYVEKPKASRMKYETNLTKEKEK